MKRETNTEVRELTKAELEIMQILWDKGSAFVHEIQACMPDPKPAYNTISTFVRILEKKGSRSPRGLRKSHRYYPTFGREAYARGVMQGVVQNFFNNSYAQMVSFFLRKGTTFGCRIGRDISHCPKSHRSNKATGEVTSPLPITIIMTKQPNSTTSCIPNPSIISWQHKSALHCSGFFTGSCLPEEKH